MKVKKIPIRKCVACGESKPKKELMRIVNNAEKGVIVDPGGKINGRGAYICKSEECVEKAKLKNRLGNALGTNIDTNIYEEIKEYVTKE